jgi:hypothetical protein
MSDYTEINESVEVPKNTGTKGFLRALEDILKLPRVQSIEIDSRGKVSYRYFIRSGEEHAPLKTDFETLKPYAAIRNGGAIDEIGAPDRNAAMALGQLFNAASVDHLFPVAFASGANTIFWDWAQGSGLNLTSHEELFGLPFVTDRNIPDESLILGAAFARNAALIDIRKSYKLVIPHTLGAEVPT